MSGNTSPGGELFYLLAVMLVVGVAILVQLGRWVHRRHSSPVMTVDEAREEFGELMSQRIGIAMRAAELDKIIIDKWTEWPMEYRGPLYQIIRHAQLLEETMLEEAQARRIYPRRILTLGPAIAPEPQEPNLPPEPPPPLPWRDEEEAQPSSVREVLPMPSNVHTLPSTRWINGQLVKTA